MSWLHSLQSNFVVIVPILLEGTVYLYIHISIWQYKCQNQQIYQNYLNDTKITLCPEVQK